jgi:hypothetical protein
MTGKNIAWSGISLFVPETWEIGRTGNKYLLFVRDGRSVMELKWNKIKGRFDARKQIRRLGAGFSKKLNRKLVPHDLPPTWHKALDAFEVFGFKWTDSIMQGRGALLYCPECRSATLIQFITPKGKPLPAAASEILDTFSDHRDDGFCDWALYDIYAFLPAAFVLLKYRFEAGFFELWFKMGSMQLKLYRWGPAAVLLKTQVLNQFAQLHMGLKSEADDGVESQTKTFIEWSCRTRPQTGFGRLSSFFFKPPQKRSRIWHVPETNKILGAVLEDHKVVYPEQLADVCDGYGSK